jgi:RNA polymerase sigma-70 factor (ECF subfamily)
LVSILTRLFGLHNLALAEDVVQDAFCRALETWKYYGAPQNPSGWLMSTAKHRAIDVLRREKTARVFAPEYQQLIESEWTLRPTVEDAFEGGGLNDAQLCMMFTCIDPTFPKETQIALVLHLVCGFGYDEIAPAFLKSVPSTEKRIRRAKKALSESKHLFNLLKPIEVADRLPVVLRAIYLLFNQGYHGASCAPAVQSELCYEALRLAGLLTDSQFTRTPAAYALSALLHFLAARLPGRMDADGNLLLLADQDRSNWDRVRIAEGERLLNMSADGRELSPYHLEAAIAGLHARARNMGETDWQEIVSLYDMLAQIQPSPVVALNRAIAIAQHEGPARGLEEISCIEDSERLFGYTYFYATIGELELQLGHLTQARNSFDTALGFARNKDERRFLINRIQACMEQLP